MTNSIVQLQEEQEAKRLHNKVATFFDNFQIGTLLSRSGIQKLKGITPMKLFSAIFLLPFEGNNFFRGIVTNTSLNFGKDTAYALLKNPRHNWRNLMLRVAVKVITVFSLLTDGEREKVLIIDDSTYDRSRSKFVELLARIFDHNTKTYLNGFKLLTLGWSDGASFLPLDFVLRSSAEEKGRIQEITKELDWRTCGYRRRREAMKKSTDLVENMVKRVLALGVKADYLLMDSWFSFPGLIAALSRHVPVICMAKDMENILYRYQNVYLRLSELYRRLRKRPGRSRILASVVVRMTNDQEVKIVFVRHRHKRSWLALLSTRIDLPDEEIVRIYGKRWDIEVFFKMSKQYLNLEKEVQLRDYDGLVGHATIVMIRYMFLAFEQRLHDDPRTLGSLFFGCCDEMKDLTLVEALNRVLALALDRIRSAGEYSEEFVNAMLDAVMGAAIDIINSIRQAGRKASLCQLVAAT
jgi:hypothetical protein